MDNAAPNNTLCETVEAFHKALELGDWQAAIMQLMCVLISLTVSTLLSSPIFRCLAHIINLGVTDVMSEITKMAALETATAIWEFDPTNDNNRVLGGELDMVAALRTLSVKVRVSRVSGVHFLIFAGTSLGSTHPVLSLPPE